MTVQDRLNEAERHIERIQLNAFSSEDGQTALDVLMHRVTNALERQAPTHLDISARLDRIAAILESDDN